jgi:hypothetical protein
MRTMEHVVRSSHAAEKDIILDSGRTVKQGGIFTQKPHLLCEGCNHSLGKIEDDLVKFAKPLFTTLDNTRIDAQQIRLLCAWIAVIAILSEHLSLGERTITIPPDNLIYIKYKIAPPPYWRIFCCSIVGEKWKYRYARHATSIFGGGSTRMESPIESGSPNTQISSMGMGNLFMQVFTCPSHKISIDYEIAMNAAGLTQLWPTPYRFGLFPKRTAKFPTKLILDDDQAEIIAHRFHNRLRALFKASHEGGGARF